MIRWKTDRNCVKSQIYTARVSRLQATLLPNYITNIKYTNLGKVTQFFVTTMFRLRNNCKNVKEWFLKFAKSRVRNCD